MAVGAFASRGAVVPVAPETLYERPADPLAQPTAAHPLELPHAASDAAQIGVKRTDGFETPRSPLNPAPALLTHDAAAPGDKSDTWTHAADRGVTVAAAAATPAPIGVVGVADTSGVITSQNNTPEPGSAALLLLGGSGALLKRRRR